jgi:hypothetical protein
LLDQYRADPDHVARLQRDLRTFLSLPLERQAHLRQFDRDLHELESDEQRRLWGVLERYTAWYERLSERDQQRLDAASDRAERLRVVAELRDREFVQRLPRADREALGELDGAKRAERIATLRKEERRRRQEWLAWGTGQGGKGDGPNPKGPRPAKLSDFPKDVQEFVEHKLRPMLADDEKTQLDKAEGKWPQLARTIQELSDRHPVLPPLHGKEVKTFGDLPPRLREAFHSDKFPKLAKHADKLKKFEGSWPRFALEVTMVLRQEKAQFIPPLGASRADEFPAEVSNFITGELKPKLQPDEIDRLRDAEQRWPDYPKLLLDLAKRHELLIPGMSLPGPRELWENAHAALPELPDRVLNQFAKEELSGQERSKLGLGDLGAEDRREVLKQEFFKRYPHELQQYQKRDRRPTTFRN